MSAKNFFRPSREPVQRHEKRQASTAEALGIKPPALSPEQKAGARVEAAIAGQRFAERLEAQERFNRERADYERERDEAIWKRVEARRKATV